MEVFRLKKRSEWEEISNDWDIPPFLSSRYLESFKRKSIEPIYLILKEENIPIGGIAGLIIHPEHTILRMAGLFKSLNFHSGPYLKDQNNMVKAMNSLIKYIRRRSFNKFIIMGYDHHVPFNNIGADFRTYEHCEYLIYLDKDLNDIDKSISRGIRRKLKRSVEADIVFGTTREPKKVNELDGLLDQTGESRDHRGYKDFNKGYVPHLDIDIMKRQLMDGISEISFAEKDGDILSMLYYTWSKKRAFAIFIGTNEKGYALGANALVFRRTMDVLKERGVTFFNLGGTPKIGKEGLIQFKEGLGAVPMNNYTLVSPFFQGRLLKKIIDIRKFK